MPIGYGITEGRMSKGGQNPPCAPNAPRPPRPGANGNQASHNVGKAMEALERMGTRRMVDVLDIGSTVQIGPAGDSFTAEVIGVCVYATGVEYQCAYWDGRTRKTEWLKSREIHSVNEPKSFIGFNSPASSLPQGRGA